MKAFRLGDQGSAQADGDGTSSAEVYIDAVHRGDVKKIHLDVLHSPADIEEKGRMPSVSDIWLTMSFTVMAILCALPASCESLTVRSAALTVLPDIIASHAKLAYLDVQHCPNLSEIPESVQQGWSMEKVKLPPHLTNSGLFGAAGERCWYVKLGEAQDGAGCFDARVVEYLHGSDGAKLRIDDEQNPSFNGKEVVVAATDAKDPRVAFTEGYGALMDEEFPDAGEGFQDLMELRYLNDAELNRNLQHRFSRDLSYTYCGK